MKKVLLGWFVPVMLATAACGDDSGDPQPAATPDGGTSGTQETTSDGEPTNGTNGGATDDEQTSDGPGATTDEDRTTGAGEQTTGATTDEDGGVVDTGGEQTTGSDIDASTTDGTDGGETTGGEVTTGGGGDTSGDTQGDTSETSEAAIAITVGRLHSCAITTSGAVKCWGSSDHGQIGNGVIDGSSNGMFMVPVAVDGITEGASAISSFSDHTCAVVDGSVWCWGANTTGQLGNGETEDSGVPVEVADLSDIQSVAVGGDHSCALTTGGAVKCWGKNDFGQLGDDTDVEYSTAPVDVVGLSSGVKAIAAGFGHTCAITSSDAVKCWGSNLYGELGTGVAGNGSATPQDVNGLSDIAAIGLGEYVSCAASSDGELSCWGRNESGQLGNGESGTQVQEEEPVAVTGVSSGATAVSSGYSFTCAVISGGAKCWGDNFYYVLGNGESASFEATTPVDVTGLGSGVSAIAATSSGHACALTTEGAVKCWGTNGGALGDGTNDDSSVPVDVVGLH